MNSGMNLYVMEVLDSQNIVSISGTLIVLENNPPPNTAAGENHVAFMLREYALRWVTVNVVENVKGVICADSIKAIDGPSQKFPKIEMLERLVSKVKGKGSLFVPKDFEGIEKADSAVRFLVEQGFLTSKVSYIDHDKDEVFDLTSEDVEEAKGHGVWYHSETGEAIKFDGKNFSSSFLATAKLVRLAQSEPEPEPIDENDAEAIVAQAKEDAYDEIVLWLTRVSHHGAEPLREAAMVFAAKLRERSHVSDVLASWRRSADTVIAPDAPLYKDKVQPRRDYEREDVSNEEKATPKPFGERSSFWGD